MKLALFIAIIICESIITHCYNGETVANVTTLKSVHLIMRHAARAPAAIEILPYKNYPYKNDPTKFPNGLSQLTDIGIQQSINVGEYLKDRYKGFIPKDPKNAILRATNIDRDWDTAALMGKVLWPVKEESDMPPRIFTLPYPLDHLYGVPYCPYLVQGLLDTPELREVNAKYQFLFDYISKYTGYPNDMMPIVGIYWLSAFLYQNNYNGYPTPDFVTDYYYDLIKYVAWKWYDLWLTGKQLNLKIGMFFKELKIRMETVLKGCTDDDLWYKYFFIYVTHSYDVFPTLKALGYNTPDLIDIPYGSMVIFELHEINGSEIVKVFYINQTRYPPFSGFQLKPSFCPSYDCPYQTFISGINQFIPNNYREDCEIPEDFDPYYYLENWLTITDDYLRGLDIVSNKTIKYNPKNSKTLI